MKKEFHTRTVEETEAVAKTFAESIKNEKSAFIAMYGDLGVGKTAFVRGLASCLAPMGRVKSPTYTIVNEYKGGNIPFYHFDVYRVSDDDELYATGFYDYINNGICAVEWSENIPYAIPENAYKVTIEKEGENFEMRKITIEGEKI
jgi:tRNA threonylcarbamoyladenosine biosynthesis protein TsaE